MITLFANMWHWFISLLYVQCNTTLTTMCVEAEWQSYGRKKKTLRVTTPEGLQRGTYFLSLPIRYGFPLQAAFAFLHWCLSQGIFLVVIEGYLMQDEHGEPLAGERDMPMLGTSPWPLITCEYGPSRPARCSVKASSTS